MAQSVKHPTVDFGPGHGLRVPEFVLCVGLRVPGVELLGILSLSLSLSLPPSLPPSPSAPLLLRSPSQNKLKKNFF